MNTRETVHVCVCICVYAENVQSIKIFLHFVVHRLLNVTQARKINITNLVLNLEMTNYFNQSCISRMCYSLCTLPKRLNFKVILFQRRKYYNIFLQCHPTGTSECFVTIN